MSLVTMAGVPAGQAGQWKQESPINWLTGAGWEVKRGGAWSTSQTRSCVPGGVSGAISSLILQGCYQTWKSHLTCQGCGILGFSRVLLFVRGCEAGVSQGGQNFKLEVRSLIFLPIVVRFFGLVFVIKEPTLTRLRQLPSFWRTISKLCR